MEQGSGAVQRYGTPFWPCRSAPGALQAGHQEVGWVFLSLFFSFFSLFSFLADWYFIWLHSVYRAVQCNPSLAAPEIRIGSPEIR